MPIFALLNDEQASPAARTVFDDIMRTRQTTSVNNFWRALANHPPTLRRIWENVKQVMGPSRLDALTKEMIYVAVSATNNCEYCLHSHIASARKLGVDDEQLAEVLAVAGLANETNRLANGYRVPVDEAFR
ncbi:MAG: carboxymuconolactone decarboxylase family protein [Bryobacteraceae bacterium]|nr:carboxymuconolactone decarboxylase family protein [Bryobacteraceae bacterium]